MTAICKDIFSAIHEGKWLKIEYRNQRGAVTKYWIGIQTLDVEKRKLTVEGMHLGTYQVEKLYIYIDSILSASVIDGTYCPINKELVNDIARNPDKYRSIFDNVANLKILSYLEMCNKLDTTPYCDEYELIQYLDRDSFLQGNYELKPSQFEAIVREFSVQNEKKERREKNGKIKVKQLAINTLSIHTSKGLYVLAYRRLNLDIKDRRLIPDIGNTICLEFQIDGNVKESIRKFLDADDYELLKDFDNNQEKIKDAIVRYGGSKVQVDDMPYVLAVGRDSVVELHYEYQAIIEMYENGDVSAPIKAFFGDFLDKPKRYKSYPITLINRKVNLDQLLAIDTAMRYPTAYIQGPPGTGKTNTILNTIITAFFNDKTVLFASYNNHPINGVFDKLCSLKYRDKLIPFPVLRVGNVEKMQEALSYMSSLLKAVENIKIFDNTLDKRKGDRTERAKRLTQMLKSYEEKLELLERKETMDRLLDYQKAAPPLAALFPFEADIQGRQIPLIQEELNSIVNISEEDAMSLLDQNEEELFQYLYYTSAKYVKRLNEDRFEDLRNIIFSEDSNEAVREFTKYLSNSENVRKLQKVFPVMITTCISAHRLGEPEPLFDMTILDEASQCNTAVSLLPIIRGKNLMLVGDPQQLNPVILLDELTNQKLKKEYNVSDEYDYCRNSIYKTFLASDSVSDEILLHNHYRCNPEIINFNNKKYYNSQLKVLSKSKEPVPLVYVEVENEEGCVKNVSVREAAVILEYVKANKDKSIGIITPFVNQRELIQKVLEEAHLDQVICGTVHSFQGDEKDVILFSTTIGPNTQSGTYKWLKSNRELINVATSRARDKLIILADSGNVERLHRINPEEDDLFDLFQYVKEGGKTVVSPKETNSRALGVKPFSNETEEAFLSNLTHALENIWLTNSKYVVRKDIAVSEIFGNDPGSGNLFYSDQFDFVVFEKNRNQEIPVLAIELDGKEHLDDEAVRARDERKKKICSDHNLQLIQVENTYARRYNHIKFILSEYFKIRR